MTVGGRRPSWKRKAFLTVAYDKLLGTLSQSFVSWQRHFSCKLVDRLSQWTVDSGAFPFDPDLLILLSIGAYLILSA